MGGGHGLALIPDMGGGHGLALIRHTSHLMPVVPIEIVKTLCHWLTGVISIVVPFIFGLLYQGVKGHPVHPVVKYSYRSTG